jgi:hypothetical protein
MVRVLGNWYSVEKEHKDQLLSSCAESDAVHKLKAEEWKQVPRLAEYTLFLTTEMKLQLELEQRVLTLKQEKQAAIDHASSLAQAVADESPESSLKEKLIQVSNRAADLEEQLRCSRESARALGTESLRKAFALEQV